MTNIYIFIGLAFLLLNIITYLKLIDVLQHTKEVNRNQHDILDLLEDLTMDQQLSQNELEEIKDRLTNIAYTHRNQ